MDTGSIDKASELYESIFDDSDQDAKLRAKVGFNIQTIRRRKGISQNELGAMAGIPAPYISIIENGKKSMNFLYMVKISEALQIPLNRLLYDDFTKEEGIGTPQEWNAKMEILNDVLYEKDPYEREIVYHVIMMLLGIDSMLHKKVDDGEAKQDEEAVHDQSVYG